MIHRIPPWALAGGIFLTFTAGAINAVGFLGIYHQAITHLTGTATLLGLSVSNREFNEAMTLLCVLASFFSGAVLSAFIIRDSVLKFGQRYGVVLILESSLLGLAGYFLTQNQPLGEFLASAACGMQNAMASTYSGATIRTTHLSGMITDLAILIGQRLRGIPADFRKARFFLSLIAAFILGGVVGGTLFHHFQFKTLYWIATILGTGGLLYTILSHKKQASL